MERPAASMIPPIISEHTRAPKPDEPVCVDLSPQQSGSDKRADFNIHGICSGNRLARSRRIEFETVVVEQALPRRAAANMQRPNAPGERICQTGTNAAVEGAAGNDWQQ